MASFGDQLRRIADKRKVTLETAVRRTVLGMGAQMVRMSPVDTGRFRSNWFYGDGLAPSGFDQSGSASLQRITAGVASWSPGETMRVTNSLPYARRLENGWSQQAPAGMVRTTIADFQARFSAELKGTQ